MTQETSKVETAEQFLQRMHVELADNYRFRGEVYPDLCFLIAMTIGKKHLAEEREPIIDQILCPSTRTKNIVPLRYSGRVQWGSHSFCVCDGKAWDPVLPRPEPIENYMQELFGEKLGSTTRWKTEDILGADAYYTYLDLGPPMEA